MIEDVKIKAFDSRIDRLFRSSIPDLYVNVRTSYFAALMNPSFGSESSRLFTMHEIQTRACQIVTFSS